jgi:CRISPR-associated exonuclease Cas4
MPYFVVFLLLLSLYLFWWSSRKQRETGLPAGRLVYDDASGWNKVERPLFDAELGLAGKPDYILVQNGHSIPVEVKSSSAPVSPYENHVYQLAAYCMLVERCYGVRPPYGILRYRNHTFEIDYTEELEQNLLDLLSEMRQPQKRNGPDRSHEEAGRCHHCSYRSACNQALTAQNFTHP